MDLVAPLLDQAQNRARLYQQPGKVVAAQMNLLGGRPFLALAYEFARPKVTQGIVIVRDLDGDYLNVTPYHLLPNLAEGLSRANRLAAPGYCLTCGSARKPDEKRLDAEQWILTCPDCGKEEVVP